MALYEIVPVKPAEHCVEYVSRVRIRRNGRLEGPEMTEAEARTYIEMEQDADFDRARADAYPAGPRRWEGAP